MKYLPVLTALLASLLSAGCTTSSRPAADNISPLDEKERNAFYEKARAPQMFGITVYTSQEGGGVFGGAHRLHPGDVAVLPFHEGRKTGIPAVSVNLGGPGNILALIDTSARDNWVSLAEGRAASLVPLAPPAYTKHPEHVVDDVLGMLCVAPVVRLGDARMENAVFFVRAAHGPLGGPARMLYKPAPDAVLGCSFLKAFSYVSIDFTHGIAVFSASTDYLPDAKRLLTTVPLVDTAHGITVEVDREGEKNRYVLDSGGEFDVVMKTPPDQPLRQISVGDLVLRRVLVEPSTEKGLGAVDIPRIGRGILGHFVVTLDFRQKKVYLEKPE
jgi:hypothetical protein